MSRHSSSALYFCREFFNKVSNDLVRLYNIFLLFMSMEDIDKGRYPVYISLCDVRFFIAPQRNVVRRFY